MWGASPNTFENDTRKVAVNCNTGVVCSVVPIIVKLINSVFN